MVLPFFAQRSLPDAMQSDPPPPCFRSPPAPTADASHCAAGLEGVRGLLHLCGLPAAAASALCLRLRRLSLTACTTWRLAGQHAGLRRAVGAVVG